MPRLPITAAALIVLADRLTPLVPFRYETAVTHGLFGPPGSEGPIEPYLRELTARLAQTATQIDQITRRVVDRWLN